MKRREFIGLGVMAGLGSVALSKGLLSEAHAAGAVADKDVLKEGQPTSIANYCEKPKKGAKACPAYPGSGDCSTCMFYNTDKSETTFKGKKVAKCQLLADPKKAQYVLSTAYCAAYVAKPKS